jgi:intracellular multiplication protein IcmV
MAIRDIFKLSRKTFFNPSKWVDFDGLRSQTRTMWGILANLFAPSRSVREETFAQAQARLKLKEEDIVATTRSYQRYALIFSGLGLFAFVYAFYLLFRYFTITGWLLGLAAAALFFTQAFRFDFWAFQMHERRLGITFKEWKDRVLGKKG